MSWLWYRGHTLLEAAKMVNRRYQKSVFDEDKEETEEQWLEYWSRVYLRRGNWPQDLEEFNVRLKGARNQDLLSALLVPSPLNESDEVRALGYDRQKRLSQANKGQP